MLLLTVIRTEKSCTVLLPFISFSSFLTINFNFISKCFFYLSHQLNQLLTYRLHRDGERFIDSYLMLFLACCRRTIVINSFIQIISFFFFWISSLSISMGFCIKKKKKVCLFVTSMRTRLEIRLWVIHDELGKMVKVVSIRREMITQSNGKKQFLYLLRNYFRQCENVTYNCGWGIFARKSADQDWRKQK